MRVNKASIRVASTAGAEKVTRLPERYSRLAATRHGAGAHPAAQAAGMRQLDCFASLNAVPFYAASGFLTVGPVEVPLAGAVRLPSALMRPALWRLPSSRVDGAKSTSMMRATLPNALAAQQ
ncbi:MAG: hypothetical protein WDN31_10975 [Hyphomicrobium sp.]